MITDTIEERLAVGSVEKNIEAFHRKLMICGSDTKNTKELELIDILESLLFATERKESLDAKMLGKARYKVSRVPCFSEKYQDIVDFLCSYESSASRRDGLAGSDYANRAAQTNY
jgi:hypothetical protein